MDSARDLLARHAIATMADMNILSIQSHVAYGHAGNAAAVFPLQRLGFEVWPVHTVMFSNHSGYPGWRGPVLAADDVRAVIGGLEALGVLGHCDAVISGYVGNVALGQVVLEAVARVRAANPAAVYCCDPVMGDADKGLYVEDDVPAFLRRHAVAAADIITPNPFELTRLSGLAAGSLEEVLAACDAACAMGPNTVLVTSLTRPEADGDTIEMLLSTEHGAWLVATPRFDLQPAPGGAGDVATALFTAFYVRDGDPAAALAGTAARLHAVFAATAAAGARELQLVAAQDAIARPREEFPVTRVR